MVTNRFGTAAGLLTGMGQPVSDSQKEVYSYLQKFGHSPWPGSTAKLPVTAAGFSWAAVSWRNGVVQSRGGRSGSASESCEIEKHCSDIVYQQRLHHVGATGYSMRDLLAHGYVATWGT